MYNFGRYLQEGSIHDVYRREAIIAFLKKVVSLIKETTRLAQSDV
jgi:hypothetical protein